MEQNKEKNSAHKANKRPDTAPALLVERHDRIVYRVRGGQPERELLCVQLPEQLLPSSSYGAVIRSEANTLLQLNQPSIGKLFELHEGETLAYTIRDQGYQPLNPFLKEEAQGSVGGITESNVEPLNEVQSIRLIADCASALAYAHQHGIVHGQISVADLFISDSRLLITGFGRPLEQEESLPEELFDAWVPERIDGELLNEKSDYFSWASLSFRLLVGSLPFQRRITEEGRHEICMSDRVISSGLRALEESALAKNVEYQKLLQAIEIGLKPRPQERASLNLQGISDALERLLINQRSPLIQAPLSQPGSRTSLRRSPWAALSLISFILVGFFIFFQLRQATDSPPLPKLESTEMPPLSERTLRLKVLADPWAHVVVDGQRLETTPFARPLQLTPGRHEVVLEHPFAPREVRIIEGSSNEELVLSVQMNIKKAINWQELEVAPPVEESP